MLIVDDEEETRKFLKWHFEQEGFLVRDASSGEQALEELEKKEAQLVLMDMQMPGMGGLEALKIIKQRNSRIHVLIVTGDHDPAKIEKVLQAGANHYILKPFTLQELTKQVHEIAAELV